MQWFDNMTLKGKLLTGFILVAMIAAVIGGVGIYDIKKIDDADTKLYEKMTVPLGQMADISVAFQRIRVNARDLIAASSSEDKKRFSERIKELREAVDKDTETFEKTLFTDEGHKLFEEFKQAKSGFRTQLDKVISLAQADRDAEATALLQGEAGKASRVEQDAIDKLMDLKVKAAKLTSDQNTKDANHATLMMSILLGVGILLAIGLGLFIARIVMKQLGADPKEVGEIANLVAVGDLSREITLVSGDTGSVMAAMKRMVDTIKLLVSDAGMLSDAAIAGKLATRADVSKHHGDFQKIVAGVNDTLDAVIGPLNVAAEYVDRISKGDIPPKITDNYNGDFNEIKLNLNNAIDNINALVADANMLSKAAVEGKLATRADASKHQGDFQKIVAGVNDCLDSVIGPLNVAAEYVDRISKGDIPPKITDNYNGDFNEIKLNLNNAIDNINALVSDAGMLANAAAEGRLATRADASKHQGDYQKIVIGVNQTLDDVIGPLNVAAEYVDRISKGDIPPQIMDNYNGDFNEIKLNLNNAIDNINALVADANMLAQAAADGKLSTRADASKHQGDYQKIVAGVNQTLDDVIGPLNVAADYVDKISKGEIPAEITDSYNGDFNTIKNNLNTCIQAVNALVADANMLSKAAVEGKLATRADATKHQGDFQKVVAGVNDCLDAVIGPLNVAAEYVDRISKGDIPPKITDNYNGDFNEIKLNLNNAIDNINALVSDAGMLANAAAEGRLATRADASKHQGDYQKIVIGVNQTLDDVIGPLNVAAEYVDRISKGDIPPQIMDNYNGDFNEIKNNLNNMVQMMNDLLAQTDILIRGAADGELDKRANAELFVGGWKQLVSGVNDTVVNIVNPLRVTADYVDKVAKGIIPPTITDSYKGEYNVIKGNLNNMVQMMNDLLAQTDILIKGAADGELDKRANAELFVG
ncbi:MAG: MCP four helix bundle domain-containing protein, partial [Desulfuromonadales bacterium]|nr:MCP four helix bundle domain-containing protein [Desulfuromonadales bacterium]